VSATWTRSETGPAGADWEWDHSDEKESVVDLEGGDLRNQKESCVDGNSDCFYPPNMGRQDVVT
jgi:hypothetical protein